MKKAALFMFSLVFCLSFMIGSVSASTELDAAIDEVMGTPYVWAGTTTSGFDCSGFTMYIYSQIGVDLPHSSRGQNSEGYWIPKSDLRAGDLVFFNTGGAGISHVGIYVGDGYFVHSASTNGVTKNKLSESYYAKRYVSARRIMWDDLYNQATTENDAK